METVLHNPVISEKSMKAVKDGYYTFLVSQSAKKGEIAKSIEDKFLVNVVSISTIRYKGGIKMQRNRRSYYKISGFKKALVKLKAGQKIAIFEVEGAKEPTEEPKVKVKETKNILRGTKVKIEKEPTLSTLNENKVKKIENKTKASFASAEKQERTDQQLGKGEKRTKKGSKS